MFFASLTFFLYMISAAALHVIFFRLLPAYTRAGREKMHEVDQLRRWLMQGPDAEKTPGLFEQYLPYAVALEVESEWARHFATALDGGDEEGYMPAWYHGVRRNYRGVGGLAITLGERLASAISSASSPPSSD